MRANHLRKLTIHPSAGIYWPDVDLDCIANRSMQKRPIAQQNLVLVALSKKT